MASTYFSELGEVWKTWVYDYIASTARRTSLATNTASNSNSSVWTTWTADTATSSSSTDATVTWIKWNEDSEFHPPQYSVSLDGIRLTPGRVIFTPLKETSEQKRARATQRKIDSIWREIVAEELRLEREAAEVTAQELLLELIGEDQFKVYSETGRVFVKGRKHDYLLIKEGGVRRIYKDRVEDLCIHLQNSSKFPLTDNVVGLKLMIEGSEREFNKRANVCRQRSLKEISWRDAYKEAVNG